MQNGDDGTLAAPATTPSRPDQALLIERVRAAARAEIVGFLAGFDGGWPASLRCTNLVRAWHALASLEAVIAGESLRPRSEFVAALGHEDRRVLPPELRDMTGDFAAAVIGCALSDPWVATPAPSNRQFEDHRRVLLRVFADLNRRARVRLPPRRMPWRRLAVVALVVGLPAIALVVLYRPRWRVSYYPNMALSGTPVFVARVLEPDRNYGPLGPDNGVPNDHFSVRFEACLDMKMPANVIFTVGSDDGARLFLDDRKVIDDWTDHPYTTHQQSVDVDRGPHTLRLDYYQAAGDARVSFDGRVGESASDITRMLHLPASKGPLCR